ncbi:MAG: metallophosphoesterase [Paludibacteraceae bacterium]|nr:metallophosphoesterase [Paludibacteraceae bacterium]MCK9615599.1 metallophosphoesterase [Candidatus Omnitrophota bacterium]
MARFGFFTDAHLTENRPVHRIDDYINTIPEKIEMIYDFAAQNEFDFMTFGGDLCDRFQIFSYPLINRVIKAINLTTYSCVGEHDLCAHAPETFGGSALSFICTYCPDFKILWKPVHLENGISIYAKHEWETMESAEKTEVDKSRFNVLLCHELLYDKKMPFKTTFTKDLDLPFDLVCSGDLHCGFSPHKVRNTWYCNPGSLARKTTADEKRMPKMLMIDAVKGKEPGIREIIIPRSRPGSEVFSVGISETVKKLVSGMDVSGVVNSINETMKLGNNEHSDIFMLFDEHSRQVKINENVLAYYHEVCEKIKKTKVSK